MTNTQTLGRLESAITPERCCAVSGGGSGICRPHILEGWTYVQGGPNEGFKGRGVDKLHVGACGCIVAVLSSFTIAYCATHRHGTLACCAWAQALPCVCYQAFACPVHGTHHHGTHD